MLHLTCPDYQLVRELLGVIAAPDLGPFSLPEPPANLEQLRSLCSRLVAVTKELTPRLPLRGTTFQRMVWSSIQSIPFGETRSYAYLAASLREPHAVRAVANACAANTVALIVPCHRVVKSDGSIGGYRWGAIWKSALLEAERQEGVLPESALRST